MGKFLQIAGAALLGALAAYLWIQTNNDVEVDAAASNSYRAKPGALPARSGSITKVRPTTSAANQRQFNSADVAQAFAEIAHQSSEFEQSAALYRLMTGQDAAGIERLLVAACQSLNGGDYVAASAILFGRYAELDADGAIGAVLARTELAQSNWLRSVFHALARLDLDDAVLRAQTLPGSLQAIAARAILNSRDDLSDTEYAAIAASLNAPRQRRLSSSIDFATAWQEALASNNLRERQRRLYTLAAQWAATDPEQAIQASKEMPTGSLRTQARQVITQQWAQSDPEAAFAWVLQQPTSQSRSQMLQAVLSTLAKHDLDSARALTDTLSGNEQRAAMFAIAAPWAAQDPEAAVAWVASLDSHNERVQALQTIGMQLAHSAPSALEHLLAAVPESDAANLQPMIAGILATVDPAAAAQMVARIDNTQQYRNTAANLVTQWAQQDPAAARRWIETQSNDKRRGLYKALTRGWSQHDAAGALQFAQELGDPASRDNALLGTINAFYRDPSRLEELYQQLTTAEAQLQAAGFLYSALQGSDPARAAQYRDQFLLSQSRANQPGLVTDGRD